MYDIFTYIWLIFMINVGEQTHEYTSPMDPMGRDHQTSQLQPATIGTNSPLREVLQDKNVPWDLPEPRALLLLLME